MTDRLCSADCLNEAEYYVMGKNPNDWGDYYCEDHLQNAKENLGPGAIVELVNSSG